VVSAMFLFSGKSSAPEKLYPLQVMARQGNNTPRLVAKNSRNNYLLRLCHYFLLSGYSAHVAMRVTGSLQSLWPVLPPSAQNCTV
jgi:hypothetical protein